MSKVVLDVSMSLDGFIAGPNGREAEPRRIPPRKSGPPRRSRGTPIRIQRRASRSRNCPRRLRTRTSRAASSLDTSDLTRVRQERSGSGDRCTERGLFLERSESCTRACPTNHAQGTATSATFCARHRRSEKTHNHIFRFVIEITDDFCGAMRLHAASCDHLRPSRKQRVFRRFSALSDLVLTSSRC